MGEHLFKNWPVYILLAGFIIFVTNVYIHSRKGEKGKEAQNKTGPGENPAEKK